MLAIVSLIAFSGRKTRLLLLVLIILSVADVYTVSVQLEYYQVPQVTQSVANLFKEFDYSYSTQRSQNYFNNSRFSDLASFILGGIGGNTTRDNGLEPYGTVGAWGALYWNTESFTFQDSEASIFRTDTILFSVNDFRSIWIPPSQVVLQLAGYPIANNTAYLSMTGYSEPKLQLFSTLNVLPNENQTARVLGSPNDNGEMVFTSSSDLAGSEMNNPIVKMQNTSVSFTDQRLNFTAIKVEDFSFDALKLLVNTGSNSPTVLYYSDGWSANWHAYVNGSEVPLIRANVGFKAIILPPGTSNISFVYSDLTSEIVIDVAILLGITSFLAVFYLFFRDVALMFERIKR